MYDTPFDVLVTGKIRVRRGKVILLEKKENSKKPVLTQCVVRGLLVRLSPYVNDTIRMRLTLKKWSDKTLVPFSTLTDNWSWSYRR